MNKLKLSISSVPENIHMVEQFIEKITDTFEVSEKLQGSILMAIIEATNNAIIYGNKTNLEKPRDFDPFGHAGLSPLVTI